ncbi:MAG: hypothetical protein HC890_15700, partial [Chloroflexaceae bacterium]|nr:hypothetical protein [Chloroflexaceae bacterium]
MTQQPQPSQASPAESLTRLRATLERLQQVAERLEAQPDCTLPAPTLLDLARRTEELAIALNLSSEAATPLPAKSTSQSLSPKPWQKTLITWGLIATATALSLWLLITVALPRALAPTAAPTPALTQAPIPASRPS